MAAAAPPTAMPAPPGIDTPPPSPLLPGAMSPASTLPNSPGQYGETQTHEGVDFVILNDDVLTSVANATIALDHGHAMERMAVLYQFPQFLEHCPHDTMHTMVPRICAALTDSPADVQMAAAEALYFVVNMRAPPDIAKHIVVATLSVISASPEGEVFDACGEILSMMLPQVARPDVLELVVPATRQRAASDKAESRRLAARIIGSLNDSLTAEEMQNLFLQHALNLADDRDETVRAMMAQSLAAVGIKLSPRVSHERLWPKLLVLIKDENVRVRAAAMRALAKTVEKHHQLADRSSMYSKVFKPLFLEECEKARAVAIQDLRNVDDDTYLMLEIFSEVYGYFLISLYKLFKSEKEWAIAREVYRSMASCNGPTVRHWCAFNMPAVATVMSSPARDVIVTLLQSLSIDTDVETRATLAAGIKETAAVLCRGAMRGEIIQSISTLFMDENAQVRMNALRHLSELVILLSPGEEANLARVKAALRTEQRKGTDPTKRNQSGEKPDTADADSAELRRLAQIFSSLEMMPFDSWRTQEILAEELRKSAHLVPQQMLCENVAPLLFQMARESTYLVRKASMRALMHALRYIPDVRRRNHILKHFRQEWARGQVYWTRLAFIDGAEFALDIVSTRLFNQMFKRELLRLSNDEVPNVKARLLKIFSRLVSRWGEDKDFVAALELLSADSDKQVSQDASELLRKLRILAPLSDQERKEEQRREAQEDAFFVHKPKRKKAAVNSSSKGSARPTVEEDSLLEVGSVGADKGFVRQPLEEQKGSSALPHPVDHATRREGLGVGGIGQHEAQPKKPGLFKQLFGGCFGG